MKLSVLVLGPGSAVHVIHPSVYFRDHQRTRPDGSPSSADSGRIDERETYRLVSKSSSRGKACWASATKSSLRSIHKPLYDLPLRFQETINCNAKMSARSASSILCADEPSTALDRSTRVFDLQKGYPRRFTPAFGSASSAGGVRVPRSVAPNASDVLRPSVSARCTGVSTSSAR